MTKQDKNFPWELDDTNLDAASGGLNLGSDFKQLKPFATSYKFDDGALESKVVYAEASGSGNVAGNGGAPTPTEYTFEEDIGDDIIPVTYKLGN